MLYLKFRINTVMEYFNKKLKKVNIGYSKDFFFILRIFDWQGLEFIKIENLITYITGTKPNCIAYETITTC
jgi:hypothetical protein